MSAEEESALLRRLADALEAAGADMEALLKVVGALVDDRPWLAALASLPAHLRDRLREDG